MGLRVFFSVGLASISVLLQSKYRLDQLYCYSALSSMHGVLINVSGAAPRSRFVTFMEFTGLIGFIGFIGFIGLSVNGVYRVSRV